MSNMLSSELQVCMVKFINTLIEMKSESMDLYKLYWAEVSPDPTFTAAANTDPIIYDPDVALTKNEIINAHTFIDNFNKFIDNNAVTTADYFTTIQNTLYGNDQRTAGAISAGIESYGYRAKMFCNNALTKYKEAKCIYKGYFATELSAMVSALSSTTVVFGADYTASEAILGVTLVEQFINMIENSAVTQADYNSTLSKWKRLDT